MVKHTFIVRVRLVLSSFGVAAVRLTDIRISGGFPGDLLLSLGVVYPPDGFVSGVKRF